MNQPHHPGAFLDLSPDLCDFSRARVAILPCPFDGTSTYAKGADRGPSALIDATPQLEHFDMELGTDPYRVGIHTLPAVTFDGADPAEAVQRIETAARHATEAGKFLFGLGGEHSVTVGLTRAVRAAVGSFNVLQIDAHADLRDQYMGSPYNHACVMRRVAEDDPDATIVSVGIRAACEEEIHFARDRSIHVFPGHEIARRQDWMDDVIARLADPVYVTVDLDGLDPSILPSTGTPVPGGLGWYETLELLRRVGAERNVIACDVTELKPDGVNHHSEFLAAQLAYKMIAYFTAKEP